MFKIILVAMLFAVSAANSEELLKDPDLDNAIQHIQLATVDGEEGARCVDQYYANGVTRQSWGFVEVCDKNCFCDNPDNPIRTGSTTTYESNDGWKELVIDHDTGEISVYVDTSKEWNWGCALNAPVNGEYSDRKDDNTPWNWNHLLINQYTNDFAPNDYESLIWKFDARLDVSTRTFGKCNPKVFEHSLWYIALRIMPKEPGSGPNGFALHRLWGTANGWEQGELLRRPFNGLDPVNNFVYISTTAPSLGNTPLELGEYKSYQIDIKRLFNEALAAQWQKQKLILKPDDYYIDVVFFGYEIWGGFELGVTTKNMSIQADEVSDDQVGWYRYWNPNNTDHFYGKYFNPRGFSGWKYEGQVAWTPLKQYDGMVPLYEYWNGPKGDHFYTTGLFPFGAGGSCEGKAANEWCGNWQYAGISAYVFLEPGPDRIPVYEMWNPKTVDHLYVPRPRLGEHAGYKCAGDCDVPKFYMMK